MLFRSGVLSGDVFLVAKEYVAAQYPDDPGVLILSRFAGAANQLRSALLVNPSDPESVASALNRALTMPLAERRARHDSLYASIREYDVDSWQREFLAALRDRRQRDSLQSDPFGRQLRAVKPDGEPANLLNLILSKRSIEQTEAQ